MAQHFYTSQWLAVPVEKVFAFFANPANLPLLMPPGMGTRIEQLRVLTPPPGPIPTDPKRCFTVPAAGIGSEIDISFRPIPLLPFRTGWLARIIDFQWNSHFMDEQIKGPFRSFRHRHGIVAEWRDGAEGTLISDSITFELPFGMAGILLETFVRRNLQKSFAARQIRLPHLLGL